MGYRFDYDEKLMFDDANLFKEMIFDVFPNIEYIDIYTGWNKGQCYLSPMDLLPRIKDHHFKRITIESDDKNKFCEHICQNKPYSWIKILWESTDKTMIVTKYTEEGLNIYLDGNRLIIEPMIKSLCCA